jgi:hypothetical protein
VRGCGNPSPAAHALTQIIHHRGTENTEKFRLDKRLRRFVGEKRLSIVYFTWFGFSVFSVPLW